MDATVFQKSLADMGLMFHSAMAEFEEKLQQSKSPASDIPALASEFSAFKAFVVSSLRTLQDQISLLSGQVDSLEMRSRRKMLLLHGIPEASKEDTAQIVVQTVSVKLKQPDFSIASIGRCHRMGRASSDKPRPILCKFRELSTRDKIWSSKSALKDTGITISEFLTKTRHDTFMLARQRFGIKNCWTRQGFVFVLGSGGKRHRVSCAEDLNKVPQVEATVPKPAVSSAVAKDLAAPTKTRRAAISRK